MPTFYSSISLFPENPLLLFHKVLVRGGLSHVPLPPLLLPERLHPQFLGLVTL